MADVRQEKQEEEEEKVWRKRHERRVAMHLLSSAEKDWHPNEEESQENGWNAGNYFATRVWDTDEISKRHTPDPSLVVCHTFFLFLI